MVENLKRSEKHRLFKNYGVPRYVLLDEKAKKKEQLFWSGLAMIMLILSFAGRSDVQRTFGTVSLFLVCLVGVFDR